MKPNTWITSNIEAQHNAVILRAVHDVVSQATGATQPDVNTALTEVQKLLDAEAQVREEARRAPDFVLPRYVPAAIKDIPVLPVTVSRKAPEAAIASIAAKITEMSGGMEYADALQVSRRVAAIACPADDTPMSTHTGIAAFGFGDAIEAPARPMSLYAVERVPSSEYLGMHVLQRLRSGWGTYDLHIMQGVAPEGNRRITLSFGTKPAATMGVQKLVTRVVLCCLPAKARICWMPTTAAQCLRQTWAQVCFQDRMQIEHALSDMVYQWNAAENESLPADERLQDAELLAVAAVPGSRVIRLRLTTKAGQSLEAVLPLDDPRCDMGIEVTSLREVDPSLVTTTEKLLRALIAAYSPMWTPWRVGAAANQAPCAAVLGYAHRGRPVATVVVAVCPHAIPRWPPRKSWTPRCRISPCNAGRPRQRFACSRSRFPAPIWSASRRPRNLRPRASFGGLSRATRLWTGPVTRPPCLALRHTPLA